MKYTKINNIHIIEVPVGDFKIILNDSKKKTAASKNYCNAGFFANFKENKQCFTLPVAHLLCDYDATSSLTKHYCTERGRFNGNKFAFDASTWSYNNPLYKKAISTLLVKNGNVEIKEIVTIPTNCDYAISGIPIMRNGLNVNFERDVVTQGWNSSPLYGTWHIFVGLKKNTDVIYVIGMKTTTWNMVKTNEAYNKFKALEMYDVIKLDGGGSFYMNVDGKAVVSTSENRLINTIICFNGTNNSIIDADEVKNDTVIVNGIQNKDSVINADVNKNNIANVGSSENKNTINKVSSNKSNINIKRIKPTPRMSSKKNGSSAVCLSD